MNRFKAIGLAVLACWLIVVSTSSLLAFDADPSRSTLAGIKGVRVIVEDLQPNFQKYSKQQDLSKETLQKAVESQLRAAGIKVYSEDEWLRTPGRPVLYINVNTDEYEKYRFAYNTKVAFQQIVSPEINPNLKTLATTWSMSTTGSVNIGTVNIIYDCVKSLTDLFIKANLSVNTK